jgi:hypothetical protein
MTELDWAQRAAPGGGEAGWGPAFLASGREFYYLVTPTPTGTVLTRWNVRHGWRPTKLTPEEYGANLAQAPDVPSGMDWAARFEAGYDVPEAGWHHWFRGRVTEARMLEPGEVIRTRSGRIVTEEDIERWAAEAERGYDPAPAPPPHPELGPGSGHQANGPAGCSRCQLVRDNAHWMALPGDPEQDEAREAERAGGEPGAGYGYWEKGDY